MAIDPFLDRVFKGPKVKYYLDLFTQREKSRLQRKAEALIESEAARG
jgi:hypothetical protein